jgi:hypothetical protein
MKNIFMILGPSVLDDGSLPIYDHEGKYRFNAVELEAAKAAVIDDNPHDQFVVVQVVGTYTGEITPKELPQ